MYNLVIWKKSYVMLIVERYDPFFGVMDLIFPILFTLHSIGSYYNIYKVLELTSDILPI